MHEIEDQQAHFEQIFLEMRDECLEVDKLKLKRHVELTGYALRVLEELQEDQFFNY